ncbi:4-hydroxy-3-methylbut-2-enyl diphosphate reductase [Thermoanaerobacterium thermosaccharolyticum]|jgi:4-hydroxy-3-methylbut-2-en-1-yl diphosphate reductase|uniref:4-hydroxy-3-methylbut-2-enyl diphosphate reductase n=1 Tax=Thermoanaerobacterium thermosaccharolyticum M0795 TaxID=698948 RepID=L0IJN8_THETR|nr:4-hydroxy-3-methylbut-2-enyl diphosphate reductase [Thermoanaerobacterium thermosaccharolyticum]AGB18969.1 (E)-4-hydroxy-3-methyl-but-2-enyl pyrophosphate reductase [Thermoanaerobacterium thermosaccharolyticum M0795]KAA5807686.1 4-hydroxy-3-methylbut-2-enyl diphosphate reductase [Thermoanaerobacterium thermosaccharolyticum]PHO07680.1 4-hydroxy-3-methylbut-2-enyl diphosphate reductase [Thermoanaerobacterium thermosaccharolyticum]TCW37202.1 4-hydroxy-3-methylbut-2-enyl diphosphate reductase [T
MKILIADNAGFCFGVKRAVKMAYDQINRDDSRQTYTYGELIHNPQVVKDLEGKGIKTIGGIDNLKENDRIIIRTHGIPEKTYKDLKEKKIELIDMTCPFVKRVQKIVNGYYKKGYTIVIIGDKNHPEVIGVNGWCDNSAYVIESVNDVQLLPYIDKACVVAQTTITQKMWEDSLNLLKLKVNELVSFNTICDATNKRQSSAEEISKKADVMIVIGGKNSSNTQKLKRICEKNCKRTIQVENADEIDLSIFNDNDIVGITAGASTPDYLIQEVINKIAINRKEDTNG